MIYDVIIIGGGPAGLTAGLYVSRAGKKAMIIENYAIGGQASLTHEIVNYPGIKSSSGFDLTLTMQEQAQSFGAEFVYDNIIKFDLEKEIKEITTEYSGVLQAKNVILAMGAKARALGIEREKELIGKGVSYCATCDGNFFKGKVVAVVGGGDTALTDTLYLNELASKVYIIHRRDQYRGSQSLIDKVKESSIEELLDSQIIKLTGAPLESIQVKHNKTQEIKEIEVQGLFVAVGNAPQTELIKDVLDLDNGYIVTDEEMKTKLPGVYAAGDIRKKRLRQVVTACADGAIAATHIYEHMA